VSYIITDIVKLAALKYIISSYY